VTTLRISSWFNHCKSWCDILSIAGRCYIALHCCYIESSVSIDQADSPDKPQNLLTLIQWVHGLHLQACSFPEPGDEQITLCVLDTELNTCNYSDPRHSRLNRISWAPSEVRTHHKTRSSACWQGRLNASKLTNMHVPFRCPLTSSFRCAANSVTNG
jgi:hypothetical protein